MQTVPVDDRNRLAAGYWEHYRRTTSIDRAERLTADDTQWAWAAVDDLVRSHPEAVVEVLVTLADTAPDDEALAYLGAGPVEDLIRNASDVVVDRIEGAACRNENFRTAVRCAWFDHAVSETVAARLRAFGEPY